MSETRYGLWMCENGHKFQAEYDMEFDEDGEATEVELAGLDEEEQEEVQMECPECETTQLALGPVLEEPTDQFPVVEP